MAQQNDPVYEGEAQIVLLPVVRVVLVLRYTEEATLENAVELGGGEA